MVLIIDEDPTRRQSLANHLQEGGYRIAASDGISPAQELGAASLEIVESEHIRAVLEACRGNVSVAARVLGLHRRTLQRKLHRGATAPPLRDDPSSGLVTDLPEPRTAARGAS